MKTNKWVSLFSLAVLPLYSGCAQAPNNGYPTTVVRSGQPSSYAPVYSDEAGGAPPDPQQSSEGPPIQASATEMQSSGTVPANISPATAEIIKMAEGGSGEDVLVAYAKNSPTRYDLNADQILYLKDLGVSQTVIAAMVSRDGSLPQQQAGAAPAPAPAPIQEQEQQPPPPGQAPVVSGPVVQAQPTYVSNPPEDVNYFYEGLSPYGTWVVLDGVGWCWQPRAVVINHAWSPYCDSGHWAWTECGWCWVSDYSWGWAPFHYGRWYHHDRCGWVWTPDRVWGPAWVTWRTGGDYCGWAPLPPHAVFVGGAWRFNGAVVSATFDFGLRPDHFTFIAVHDFTRHDYFHSRLPVTQVRNVYNRTTIINNTTIVNNTIVNRGVPVEHVASVTHTKIERVPIRHESGVASRLNAIHENRRSGVVLREEPKAPSRPVRVVAQRVDQNHPVVQHADIRPATTTHTTGGRGQQRGGGLQVQQQNQDVQRRQDVQRNQDFQRNTRVQTTQPQNRAETGTATTRSEQNNGHSQVVTPPPYRGYQGNTRSESRNGTIERAVTSSGNHGQVETPRENTRSEVPRQYYPKSSDDSRGGHSSSRVEGDYSTRGRSPSREDRDYNSGAPAHGNSGGGGGSHENRGDYRNDSRSDRNDRGR